MNNHHTDKNVVHHTKPNNFGNFLQFMQITPSEWSDLFSGADYSFSVCSSHHWSSTSAIFREIKQLIKCTKENCYKNVVPLTLISQFHQNLVVHVTDFILTAEMHCSEETITPRNVVHLIDYTAADFGSCETIAINDLPTILKIWLLAT